MDSGNIRRSCRTCAYLGECKDVTDEHIRDDKQCRMWQAARDIDLAVRREIERDFGAWALRYGAQRLTEKWYRRNKHG